jgi:transcriptional regulator with XRE-family HTH domain
VSEQPGRAGFSPRDMQGAARIALGAALARLRRERGITGQQLGRLAGMSQAKVSKIETGTVAPSPSDVERLARALDAPESVVVELRDRASGLRDQFTDWRLTAQRLAASQQALAQDEERATRIAVFQVGVVPGLLQTTEYARAVLGDYTTVLSGADPGLDSRPPGSAVTIRIQRQEVLDDQDKRFDFVIAESVLSTMVGGPAEMLAQLQRIRTVAAQPNTRVAVLPWNAALSFPPLHGFHLFDDRAVMIDLISTSVTSTGSEDIRVYRAVYDHFRAHATTDIGPVLDRYMYRYADAARTDAAGREPSHAAGGVEAGRSGGRAAEAAE